MPFKHRYIAAHPHEAIIVYMRLDRRKKKNLKPSNKWARLCYTRSFNSHHGAIISGLFYVHFFMITFLM